MNFIDKCFNIAPSCMPGTHDYFEGKEGKNSKRKGRQKLCVNVWGEKENRLQKANSKCGISSDVWIYQEKKEKKPPRMLNKQTKTKLCFHIGLITFWARCQGALCVLIPE